MAELLFFGLPDGQAEAEPADMQARLAGLSLSAPPAGAQGGAAAGQQAAGQQAAAFDSSRQYLYQEQLYGLEGRPPAEVDAAAPAAGQHAADQQAQQGGDGGSQAQGQRAPHHGPQWAYLRFSQPVTAAADALVIGSKLDADLNAATCRLAFHGRLLALVDPDGASRRRAGVCLGVRAAAAAGQRCSRRQQRSIGAATSWG